MTSGHPRTRQALFVLIAVLVAIGSRSIPYWDEVVENGRAVVRDPDACYHLRRAQLIADSPLALGAFDPFLNHPHGNNVIWPPLYDAALALLIAVAPGDFGPPGPPSAIALLPPLLFGVIAALLFAIGRILRPGRLVLPLIGAAVPILLPVDLPATRLGQLDHHAAELLCVVAMVLALLRSLSDLASEAAPRRAALASGITLGASLLVQLSLVVLIPMAVLAVLLAHRIDALRRAQFLVWVSGMAIAVVAIPALVFHAAGAPFRHYQFGLFHLASLGTMFLLSLGFDRWLATTSRMGPKISPGSESHPDARSFPDANSTSARSVRSSRSISTSAPGSIVFHRITALACLGAAIVLLLVLFKEGIGGFEFLFRGGSGWVATIGESQSPLSLSGDRFWTEVVRRISLLGMVVPISLVVWARRSARGDVFGSVLLAAGLLVTGLALLQLRFLPHLGVFLGLAVASLIAAAQGDSNRSGRKFLVPAAIPLLAAAAIVPTIPGWRLSEPAWADFETMRPILNHLFQTRSSSRIDGEPRYGALSEWSFGHFVRYHGGWPAVVDNFGEHAGDLAVPRQVLLDTDGERAFARLRTLRVHHLLVGDLVGSFAGLLPTEQEEQRFVKSTESLAGSSLRVVFQPTIGETVLYKLVRQRGSGFFETRENRFIPALGHARLVATSADEIEIGGQLVPTFKLYEIVEGARLQVHDREPGEEGILIASVLGPRRETFPWTDRSLVDSNGIFEVRVPYPSDAPPGASRLLSCGIVFSDRRYTAEPISENAVATGAIVGPLR